MSSISDAINSMSIGSSGGGDATSQIAALNKQIQNISKRLKELATDNDLSEKQKSEQQQLLEAQIQMIEAQIAQIEQQQAEKAQQKADAQQPAAIQADGVNRPTDKNQLNLYI